MSEKTITRAELADAVHWEVGLPRVECADLVKAVLDEITVTLAQGEAVKIAAFGNFSVSRKGDRIGRNPKTGEEIPIPPRTVVTFHASQILKNNVSAALPASDQADP